MPFRRALFVRAMQTLPALFALPFVSVGANVEPSCTSVPVRISYASREEVQMACAAAEGAAQQLGRCGLRIGKLPHIRIEPAVRHPLTGGSVFGIFEDEAERIRVMRFSNMPAVVARTPFAELPLPDVYRSLIVHEITHGILHQNSAGRAVHPIASEYLAYAMQIASLPTDVRQGFLSSLPPAKSMNDIVFSDIMLAFNPHLFAARAYQHFIAQEDQCQTVHSLLQGSAAFIASSRDFM